MNQLMILLRENINGSNNGKIYKMIEKIDLRKKDILAKDKNGQTILCWVCCKGYSELVKILIAQCNKDNLRKEDIMIKDNYGRTALYQSCFIGHIDVVKILIEECSKYNSQKEYIIMKNDIGETALQCASRSNHFDIVQLLVEKGNLTKEVIMYDYGHSALYWSIYYDNVYIIKLLIDSSYLSIKDIMMRT